MSADTDSHFKHLQSLSVPAKRAAYSDRVAWMMALLSSIVYQRFDEEADDIIMTAAAELALLRSDASLDGDGITQRLRALALTLAGVGPQASTTGNAILTKALAAGGFTLVGGAPIHIPETDTQAMVVVRDATNTEPPFAVLCFRGTQQVRDWSTNIRISPQPIVNPKTGEGTIGNMHKGFHDAFISAESEIRARLVLSNVKDLPLYVTGHSLGGALAVVATWYLSSKTLAACYTFGAPRVGDDGLLGWFKTPIYRIVNAADPIPLLPPSGGFVDFQKSVIRFLGTLFPWGGIASRIVDVLIRQQNFRHYGDMKYLPFSKPVDGRYPDNFLIQPGVSNSVRFFRWIRVLLVSKGTKKPQKWMTARPDRIDHYHGLDQYREKLRAVAINRNA